MKGENHVTGGKDSKPTQARMQLAEAGAGKFAFTKKVTENDFRAFLEN